MIRYRKEKARAMEQAYNKGVPKFLGTNLTYLLRLTQVADHKLIPPVWKALSGASNRHQPTSLQLSLDETTRLLGVCAPIAATPGLLKMILYLSFRLNHRDDMGMELHKFCPGQQTYATRKFLKDRVDQHQVIAGGGGAPTMANAAYLTAQMGVTCFPLSQNIGNLPLPFLVVINQFFSWIIFINNCICILTGSPR